MAFMQDGNNLLVCSMVHERDMRFATDDEILNTVRRLAAYKQTDTKKVFLLRQQAFGFRHEPHNMLLDDSLAGILKPASQFMHDWMHGWVANGVFNTTFYLVLETLEAEGLTDIYERMGNYFSTLHFPARTKLAYAALFSAKHRDSNRKAQTFKCSASEALGIYPVFAHYLKVAVLRNPECTEKLTNACKAFVSLESCLDALQSIPYGNVDANEFRILTNSFLDLMLINNWKDWLHPKFHWVVHLPRELEFFGFLVTCWVHERKHKVVKQYATDIRNTIVFERSLLSEVVCHQLEEIRRQECFSFKVGLLTPHRAPARVEAFLVSNAGLTDAIMTSAYARISSGICTRKDIAIISNGSTVSVGEVLLHVEHRDQCLSLVKFLELRSYDHAASAIDIGTSSPSLCMVETADILCSVIWATTARGIKVLVPGRFRAHFTCKPSSSSSV